MFFDFTPTLRHYENLFLDKNFGTYMMNSIISAGGSAISVVLGSMCAYAFQGLNFEVRRICFLIISTRMAPVVAVMVPLYDLQELRIGWDFTWAILGYTTFNLPFAIWILKGFFDNALPLKRRRCVMVQIDLKHFYRFYPWLPWN